MRSLLLVCLLAASTAACAKAAPAGAGASKSSTSSPVAAAAPMPPTAEQVQEKKKRLPEAAIYVDGKPVAAIRAAELPPSLKLHPSMTGGGPHYYMGEYIKALGIDIAKVKAFHVYGGARVAAVDGDEFRRVQNGIHFSFSRGEGGGKPRIMFAVTSLKANTTVDMISAIAVYVEKDAPTIQDGALAFADGKPIDGLPYVQSELSKGTRVYVDGKLAATVKRKELPNGLLVDSDVENPRFSLPGYLKSIGVDAKQAKAMDFLSDDDAILRLDGASKAADELAFALPRHNHGQVAIPAGSAKSAKVSALQIFIKTAPPARTIVPAKDEVRDDANKSASGAGASGAGNGGNADDEL